MVDCKELAQYVDNLPSLLRQGPHFGLAIERQVQFALVPRLQGARAHLEPHLWRLLFLCLDGPDAPAPPIDAAAIQKAEAAARAGSSSTDAPARFPQAARAVVASLAVVREFGVLPKPKLAPARDVAAEPEKAL